MAQDGRLAEQCLDRSVDRGANSRLHGVRKRGAERGSLAGVSRSGGDRLKHPWEMHAGAGVFIWLTLVGRPLDELYECQQSLDHLA